METPQPDERPADRGGLPSDELFKAGAFVITGVAGGVLLGRFVAGLLRIGLNSILPVIVHQVLHKPAGSRKVVSRRSAAENPDDVNFGSVASFSPGPSAGISDGVKPDDRENEPIEFPVFLEQETAALLPEEPAPLTSPEDWRDSAVSTGGESLSSAEWAARMLDEIEDSGRDNRLPRYGAHDQAGAAGMLENGVTGDLADPVDHDECIWLPGEDMAMDLGGAPPVTEFRGRIEPEEGSGRDPGGTGGPAPVVVDHNLRDNKISAVDEGRNTGSGLGLKLAHRKSAEGKKLSYRSVAAGISQVPVTVAKAGPTLQQAPEGEVYDAFSVPFPGNPVTGVEAVENPFERGNAARVKGSHTEGMASVLVKGKRSPAKGAALGNVSLARIGFILVVLVAVGGGAFFGWSSLMGTSGKTQGHSSSVKPELREMSGNPGKKITGSAVNPVNHDSPAGTGVTTPLDDAKLINDADLPSFRSL